ncbi:acid-sensing ion channel 1A-like [Pomacea canaliculata]|uniref:acid-sensing ion channel 1A-like n=1 Tax=Pomacea canaliculata TaxID=400727 RepID=UPI000D7316A3|nr:acid-sensing ion channel 1A-like [Pomacea canaliculata]
MILSAVGFASHNACEMIIQFWKNPLSTTVSYQYEDAVEFPAVSICNMNILRNSKFEKDAFLQRRHPSVNPTFKRKDEEFEFFRNYMSSIEYSQRYDLGHQLEDMLVSCKYPELECNKNFFTKFYSQKLGNCYTINKDRRIPNVSMTGPEHGLELKLHVEEDEYLRMSMTTGFKVVVHSPQEMPFPDDEGVVVAPGFSTHIALSKVEIKRTPNRMGVAKHLTKTRIQS